MLFHPIGRPIYDCDMVCGVEDQRAGSYDIVR